MAGLIDMIDYTSISKIKRVAELAKKAAILEVNASKPGNITPDNEFEDTTYRDFLLGCYAIRNAIEQSAINGFRADRGEIRFSRIGIGKYIKKAVSDVRASHKGGNTHLGIIMLFIPLAVAAGMCISQGVSFRKKLQDNLRKCIMLSSVEDSIELYDAILISGMNNLGKEKELDVRDDKSRLELKERNINLEQLMKVSADRDTIARELSSGMGIIFDIGIPTFERLYNKIKDTNLSIIQTYLILLSRFPDSLISRKVGRKKAEEVSRKAKNTLDKGGVITEEGRKEIERFDRYLRSKGNKLNPGTTADLIAAILFVWLLNNYFE